MARVPSAPAARTRHPLEIAIDAAMELDGGARFRQLSQKWLPTITDAYRGEEDPLRSHFGISSIGRECARELFYSWRWAALKKIPARTMRLFNRGHLEEARFLALLEMVGVHIHDTGDGQERVSALGGHVGSALDGILYNVPGVGSEWILGEFKTHGTKSFTALYAANSVAKAKPEHYAQMQGCMHVRGIHKCIYIAVNKNDDDLYCETIIYNKAVAEGYLSRAGGIVFATAAPPRLSSDPSFFKCAFCDFADVCHRGNPVLKNCRTCVHSIVERDGTWSCGLHFVVLDKADQKAGCGDYNKHPDL